MFIAAVNLQKCWSEVIAIMLRLMAIALYIVFDGPKTHTI